MENTLDAKAYAEGLQPHRKITPSNTLQLTGVP
jgi:hypothetical protein